MQPCDQIDALDQGLIDVPDQIYCFTPEGRHLFINRSAAAYLNCRRDEVSGYFWHELGFSDKVMIPLTERIAQVAADDTPAWYRVYGSEERGSRVFDVSLTPLHQADDVVAVLVISRDITEYVPGK